MKRILVLGLVAVALLFAAPRAQTAIGQGSSLDRAVRDLEDTILKMDVRLERLEALAAMKSPTLYDPRDTVIDDDGTAPQTPRWVMQLDGVDTVEPDPDAYKELVQLKKDVEHLERQVERQKRSVSSTSGSGGYSSRSYRSHRTNRQGRAQGELLADYQNQYRQKKGDMKRLERQLNEPRQVILGNWNDKIITLRTTKDVSRTLNRIDTGQYLSWEGRRVREDRDSQEWVVTSIKAVDANDIPR